jgi:hypothetical protein
MGPQLLFWVACERSPKTGSPARRSRSSPPGPFLFWGGPVSQKAASSSEFSVVKIRCSRCGKEFSHPMPELPADGFNLRGDCTKSVVSTFFLRLKNRIRTLADSN